MEGGAGTTPHIAGILRAHIGTPHDAGNVANKHNRSEQRIFFHCRNDQPRALFARHDEHRLNARRRVPRAHCGARVEIFVAPKVIGCKQIASAFRAV